MYQQIFEENIIKMLGLEGLPNEKKVALLEKMTNLIQKRVMLRVAEKLPKDKQDEFIKILESQNSQAIADFIKTHIPDLPKIMQEEIIKFKEEAKDFAKNIIA